MKEEEKRATTLHHSDYFQVDEKSVSSLISVVRKCLPKGVPLEDIIIDDGYDGDYVLRWELPETSEELIERLNKNKRYQDNLKEMELRTLTRLMKKYPEEVK